MSDKDNLEQYQLNKDILNQEDYVLELWYGKAGLYFINELRKINRIEINKLGDINYYNNDNWLLQYDIENEVFWIDYTNFWLVLDDGYNLTSQQIKDLTKGILDQVTNCKIVKMDVGQVFLNCPWKK